ncbi:MAG: hypothetical protein KKA90_05100 [Nanoarchaeota archaeon]|nr:hypothetical protein [Nanoarchaeota archaeon]
MARRTRSAGGEEAIAVILMIVFSVLLIGNVTTPVVPENNLAGAFTIPQDTCTRLEAVTRCPVKKSYQMFYDFCDGDKRGYRTASGTILYEDCISGCAKGRCLISSSE